MVCSWNHFYIQPFVIFVSFTFIINNVLCNWLIFISFYFYYYFFGRETKVLLQSKLQNGSQILIHSWFIVYTRVQPKPYFPRSLLISDSPCCDNSLYQKSVWSIFFFVAIILVLSSKFLKVYFRDKGREYDKVGRNKKIYWGLFI